MREIHAFRPRACRCAEARWTGRLGSATSGLLWSTFQGSPRDRRPLLTADELLRLGRTPFLPPSGTRLRPGARLPQNRWWEGPGPFLPGVAHEPFTSLWITDQALYTPVQEGAKGQWPELASHRGHGLFEHGAPKHAQRDRLPRQASTPLRTEVPHHRPAEESRPSLLSPGPGFRLMCLRAAGLFVCFWK